MRELTKILVTGASGFIGHAVQEELRKAFYNVLAFLRPSSDPQISCAMGARIFRGNILDQHSLAQPFANGAEAVVHLVGIIDEAGDDTFHKIHVTGTRNVVELAKEFKVKKLVLVSALGSRPNAPATYHRTKWEAEEIVRKSGVPYTIIRPSVVFGDGSEFLSIMEVLARMPGVTPVLGDVHGKMQPVYVRDLARAIRVCVEDERTDEQSYDIGAPEIYTMDSVLELVEKRLGKTKKHMPVPESLGEWTAFFYKQPVLGWVMNWFHRNVYPIPPKINHDQIIMMKEDSVADPARLEELKKVLGFELTRLSSWLYSSEYVERPWSGDWKARVAAPAPAQVVAAAAPAAAAKPAAPAAAAAPAPKPAAPAVPPAS